MEDRVADGAAAASPERSALDEVRHHISCQNWEEAVEACRKAMGDPMLAVDATALMGVVAYHLDDLAQAISLFNRVVTRSDASTDVPEVLAVLYAMSGFLQEALFYGKLATARPADNRILPHFGGRLPPFSRVFYQMQERPLVQRARREFGRGDYLGAINLYQQHLALDPRDVDALDGLTEAYLESGQARLAIDLLRSLRMLAPDDARFVSRLGQALNAVGEYAEGQACHELAVDMEPSVANLAARRRDLGFGRDQALAAATAARLDDVLGRVPRPPAAPRDGRRLAVGFLCTALRADEARAVAGVLRRFDGRRAVVFAYGSGSLSMVRNQAFQGGVAHWRDLRGLDPRTMAAIIRGDGIDVLVDGCGLRAPDLLDCLASRPAAVQVAWLHGSEAVLPAAVDVVIGGGTSEVPGWPLGRAAWPATDCDDAEGAEALERDRPFTFGADATLGEMNAEAVLAWARILMAVPGAQLSLLDRDLREPDNTRRLIGLFGDFGVAHRVDVVSDATRTAFLRDVDLFLAPYPAATPLAAAQALAQGVPVVALDSRGTQAGAIADMLRDAGSIQGLAADPADYVAKAVALAGQPKASLSERRAMGAAAFDPAMLAGALMDAFERMHDEAGN